MGEGREKWYKDGLRFSCTGCGKCCTGFPGAVWVSDEEIAEIARHVGQSIEEVEQQYTRRIGRDGQRSLKEVGEEHDCVFLSNKRFCQIYEVRPKQCRRYPWWPAIMESRESWQEEKKMCEGIDHPDAPLVDAETITIQIGRDLEDY